MGFVRKWITKENKEDAPHSKNPTLTIELVDEDQIQFQIDWAPGADLTTFSQILLMLTQGNLTPAVIMAAKTRAEETGEKHQYELISHTLSQGGKPPQRSRGERDPLVSPIHATTHLLKMGSR